jgi:hydrogenase-4 component E
MDELLTLRDAGRVLDAVALGLIGLALLGVLLRRLETAIVALAAQGVLLGVAAGAVALAEMTWRPWAAMLVALAVKAAAIPALLWLVLQRLTARHEVETVVPLKLAFPLAIGFVLVAYWTAEPFTGDEISHYDAANVLPAALALLLVGLFTMVSRRKALTQIAGLVTMENGLYLAAVASAQGLPLAVELGIAMDVLTGVAIMGLVTHEIHRLHGDTDIDRLRTLRW